MSSRLHLEIAGPNVQQKHIVSTAIAEEVIDKIRRLSRGCQKERVGVSVLSAWKERDRDIYTERDVCVCVYGEVDRVT